MKLTKSEKKALRDFKKKLIERYGDELCAIILFGSKARGDAGPDSDTDILLLFKKDAKEYEDSLVEIICETLNVHGIYFEVVSFSRKEYELSKSSQWPFILNLEKEAISL